jgi:zinc protease
MTSTKTASTQEALALLADVVERFRRMPPPAAPLAKAKAYTAGQFARQVETANALSMRLGEIEFFGLPPDELATFTQRVEAVTVESAHRVVARDQPPTDAMAVVVLGKAAELRAPLEATYGPVRVVTPEGCERLVPSP